MKRICTKIVTITIASMFAFTGAFMFNGPAMQTYADVGSVTDNEEITYDKEGGVLSSIGIDTSKMPEDYNADSTDNPYGEDVATLEEVSELVKLDTTGGAVKSNLYGHNQKLDGSYDTLVSSSKSNTPSFLHSNAFASVAECDITGDGRDGALAIVYTNYDRKEAAQTGQTDRNIYMRLYNPVDGTSSEPFVISSFIGNRMVFNFLIQSQLQITAGDYDNDTVDEIAVYVPASSDSARPKVAIYDLINGKDSSDPYQKDAWQLSWNYILPSTNADIVGYGGQSQAPEAYHHNFYNNVDLASGDADNDGPCDLVVSYGSSSTGAELGRQEFNKIVRSLPSTSVILYGSNDGQMLKDSQKLDYGGDDLIRVSVAFGDLDDDGNEEMILGGQLKDEQGTNTSRLLCKYTHDQNDDEMVPEVPQNMDVINGDTDDGEFVSSNGWDDKYYSSPIMKTNLAIGKMLGKQSETRIYMDSVAYSYDNQFSIEDELEDASTEIQKDQTEKPKGSCIFTNIKGLGEHAEEQWPYYEYDAKAGNFTGSLNDYILVNRVSTRKAADNVENYVEVDASIITAKKEDGKLALTAQHDNTGYDTHTGGAPYYLTTADSDVDSTVAEYTGDHDIEYTDPKVVAVLASAPYFQDVADYDEGDMLQWCSTSFGKSSGSTSGWQETMSIGIGAVVNFDSAKLPTKWIPQFFQSVTGYHRTETWGHEDTKEFTISYDTAGGEDAVVLFSIPSENFTYNLKGTVVDDDGNVTPYEQKLVISNPHQPVTQTLTLDDYMDIQKRYTSELSDVKLPDVTQYLTSKPGDPNSYPSSETDLPQKVKDKVVDSAWGDSWAGVAYGSGTVSQTLSTSHSESARKDNHLDGGFGSYEIGWRVGPGFAWEVSLEIGIHTDFVRESGHTYSTSSGVEYSGTVANMPRSAKNYGYDFSWKLFRYTVQDSENCAFPVVTYMTDDVQSPPSLPRDIAQDFDKTTDSQTALTWTYQESAKSFEVYKYYDFPQGGGNLFAGIVQGSHYELVKDENNNTVTDDQGRPLHKYTFIDENLSADTKYQYRIKVTRSGLPSESIFSPVIEARTNVSQMPDVSLSKEKLKIYPDGVTKLKAIVEDPENYEGTINYQWQKYDEKKRAWSDLEDCIYNELCFYNCSTDDEGTYRCRINLIRKHESSPQYISVYTNTCEVKYSLRSVDFGPIEVYEGSGSSPTNTGIKVNVVNSSPMTSVEKPTGTITFKLVGPNSIIMAVAEIDAKTGVAQVDSIEDLLGTLGQASFVNGGYLVTAYYEGSNIFYAATDPEEYHYLRNIGEALFLSAKASYVFGQNIMDTTFLYDYKAADDGTITREDKTDQLRTIKFYAVDSDGHKTGDPVKTYELTGTDDNVPVPLDARLAKQAYIEAYIKDITDPVASTTIKTVKRNTALSLETKTTGTGDLCKLYTMDEVELAGDGDLNEKNIVTADGNKSLADMLQFKYYDDNGEYICNSTDAASHMDEFIPAAYKVRISNKSTTYETFYKEMDFEDTKFFVVGNYYLISASCSDENAGDVIMLSPGHMVNPEKVGYAGGTKVTLKAKPDKGFQVKRWKIEECGQNEYFQSADETITYVVKSQNTVGTGEIKITAIMEPKSNTLTYDAIGNGNVSVTPAFESGSTVIPDTALTFKAEPSSGWVFDEWRWVNTGGNSIIALGVTAEDGSNTKTFKMGDNPATVHAVFKRETIDLDLGDNLAASYINNGSNPLEEMGKEIETTNGQEVPKGTEVIVKTKAGYNLAPDATWNVLIGTPHGNYHPDLEELTINGREAVKFQLSDEAVSCSVNTETEKGRYSIQTSGDNVRFVVKVDGQEVTGNELSGIEGGSNVKIEAYPVRGKKIANWIINGETIDRTDTDYSTSLTDNLNVSVSTTNDDDVSLKMEAEGGGTAKYEITDKNGETVTGTFASEEETVTAYKGETVKIAAADNEHNYTIKTILVNGEEQDLDDGSITIKNISEDTEILCRFMPSTYCTVSFDIQAKDANPAIFDENGIELEESETLTTPYGGDITFTIVMNNGYPCVVSQDGKVIDYTTRESQGDNYVYTYEMKALHKNANLVVGDHAKYKISSVSDLEKFFTDLPKYGGRIDAVVTQDIDASGANNPQIGYRDTYYGTFDGQGKTIKNLHVGTAGTPVSGDHMYRGMFRDIAGEGVVKDLVLDNFVVHTESINFGLGMITGTNRGVISNVAVLNSELHTPTAFQIQYRLGGISRDNEGLIENCKVSNFLMDGYKYEYTTTDNVGSGISPYNQINASGNAEIKGCYVENLKVQMTDGIKDATGNIITLANGSGQFGKSTNNFYKMGYEDIDTTGTNVCKLTEQPEDREKALAEIETEAFARKLAYHMNGLAKKNLWGITSNDDKNILQIVNGGKNSKAPVKADFKVLSMTKSLYLYPGQYSLPGRETFAAMTPDLWLRGDEGYTPGFISVAIDEDCEFRGIEGISGYVASIGTEYNGTAYFKELDSALDAYEAGTFQVNEANNEKIQFRILADCTLDQRSVVIKADTEMTICKRAELTMNNNANIENKGTLVNATGSTLHKYGSMRNDGTIKVEGTFYNYGSKLTNKGTIEHQTDIICDPHRTGEWTYADKPNADGTWTLTSTCEVCTNEATKKVDPNPPANKIDHLELMSPPDKTLYNYEDVFLVKGMIVVAILKDGTKAAVTDYTMTMKIGINEKNLHDWDVLLLTGHADVTVKYEGFTCGFEMDIINQGDLLLIKDENGEEISKAELDLNGTIELTASLRHKLADEVGFVWESSDPSIADVDSYTTENKHTILTKKPGKATITVTVVDANENPIPDISPKTVQITVVEHVTDLSIVGGDRDVDAGDSCQLEARVIPEDSTDELTWTSANEAVATVDDQGLVTGIKGGEAVITVSAPSGISASCIITVKEKATALMLDTDNLTIATDRYEVLSARVEPATANGEVEWTAANSSVAGFFVKDETTGEMKVVDKVTTKLSADGTEWSDTHVIVAGVANGTAKVTASTAGADGSTLQEECTVNVSDNTSYVTITHNGASMSGQQITLNLEGRSAQFYAESSEEQDELEWSVIDDSSDPVIQVNNNGKVMLLRQGVAALKVTSNITQATDVCMIKVKRTATGVELSDDKIRLAKGADQKLIATLLPEGAEDYLIWSSSDESIATVSNDGKVTAVGEGTATISVRPRSEGASSASCEVTVYEANLTLELSTEVYTFDRKMHKPAVTVWAGRTLLGENLTKSNDKVILSFDGGRIRPGSYMVTAVATDRSYGFGTAIYQIKVKPTKILKLKKGKKKLTVKWKKYGKKNINGYQIRYSLHSDMSKAKVKNVKSYKKKSLTLKKLKSKKTYYVQIRTFAKKGGVKYYSDWSEIKKAKTK